jgi:uncharacterized protein YcbX
VITLAGLHVYPVKSCRGIALEEAPVTATGLEHDREWMVVTPGGRFLTQRELPRLALVGTRLEQRSLWLSAPHAAPLEIPLGHVGTPARVLVWRDHCAARDAGDAAARWLAEFLEREVRLVRFDAAHRRQSDPAWTGTARAYAQFADGYALLAISTASLDDLNARLPKPLPMNRFRPNLVLDGLPPYGEDTLGEFHVGGQVRLRAVKPCTRCAVTTTDQGTGAVDGAEPLRTLKTYRWNAGLRGVAFGQNVIVLAGAGTRLVRGMELRPG